MFGNLDHAWAMFGTTMVTGYPGWSGLLWLGELVIGSTIMYGGEVKIDTVHCRIVDGFSKK